MSSTVVAPPQVALRRPGEYVRTHAHLNPGQWTRMCTRCGFSGAMGAGWKKAPAGFWVCSDRPACTARKENRS